jgi:hypothetical protein
MKPSRFTWLGILLLGLPSVSNARIGETLQQCVARYGQPDGEPEEGGVHPKATNCAFVKDGLELLVTFYQGKAVDIIFSKLDERSFSPSEVEELLKANGSGWKEREAQKPDQSEWETAYGARRAMLYPDRSGEPSSRLVVFTADWNRVMDEYEATLQREELQRFGGDKDAADRARQEEAQQSREAAERAKAEVDATLRALRESLGR